jgi:hypothetical protein
VFEEAFCYHGNCDISNSISVASSRLKISKIVKQKIRQIIFINKIAIQIH